MEETSKRALIAMSGGVDSSVAAQKMVAAGYECIGCTMKLYELEPNCPVPENSKTCCALDDTRDARSVAWGLGMNYYVFNMQEDFRRQVMVPFAESYQTGRTPNPCISCNRYLKFDLLLHRAKVLGCDLLVTGHYARITCEDGVYHLKKALDLDKDQSYVLYTLTQDQLAHLAFPLGDQTKEETRKDAQAGGFVNADKAESQDICFVPDGDYASAVEALTGVKGQPGDFVDREGNVLGRHKGIIHYTVGQRRGLGLSLSARRYVCRVDPEKNQVVIGTNQDLMARSLLADDFNWIAGQPPREPAVCKGKVRYRQVEQPAVAYPQPDGRVKVVFDQPQRAITPGQAVVLYDGDDVIGGGTIVGQVPD